MRLKNDIDYKRFPEPSRGDWTRFTILVLSAVLTKKSPASQALTGDLRFLTNKTTNKNG